VFYAYDPVLTAGLTPAQEAAGFVLGGTASMWGEQVDTSNILARAWPRAGAQAERLWSSADVNDTDAATPRLEHFRCHLAQRGVPAGPLSVASDYGFCWTPAWGPPTTPSAQTPAEVSTATLAGVGMGSALAGAAIAMAIVWLSRGGGGGLFARGGAGVEPTTVSAPESPARRLLAGHDRDRYEEGVEVQLMGGSAATAPASKRLGSSGGYGT